MESNNHIRTELVTVLKSIGKKIKEINDSKELSRIEKADRLCDALKYIVATVDVDSLSTEFDFFYVASLFCDALQLATLDNEGK